MKGVIRPYKNDRMAGCSVRVAFLLASTRECEDQSAPTLLKACMTRIGMSMLGVYDCGVQSSCSNILNVDQI